MQSRDGSMLRLMMNRDERRLRMTARPPECQEGDGMRVLWPVDQEAGGTWIAVNDNGLAFALLNCSSSCSRTTALATMSRGEVIPHLVAARDVADAERRFASGPAQWPCKPFTLVVASLARIVVLTPAGSADAIAPAVWSSSTLGDQLVEAPRRRLFEQLLATSGNAWLAQDRFHQHAWPDRRHLSVLMSRPDACTVSRTEVTLTNDRSIMKYVTMVDGWPAGVAHDALALERRQAAAAA